MTSEREGNGAVCTRPSSPRRMAAGPTVAISVVWFVMSGVPLAGQERVRDTVHNLSVGGPGSVRALAESQVCMFCHAPHNTQGVRPLWNRELSPSSYLIYNSSTFDAAPGQPTGSSKLCLSCHDGTIALGSVLSREDRIRMAQNEFMPAGLSNLGTDLSDDHPISFAFTGGLAASDAQLVSPAALPAQVKLDSAGQLQCTSCHDPHWNLHGDFLVLEQEFGALCVACHNLTGWSAGAHRNSNRNTTGVTGADWPFSTVAENACRSCHRSHTAGGHERLLIFNREEDNCLSCHNGQVASTDIQTEIDKASAHDPQRYAGTHDPRESGVGTGAHVECSDCHNAHAASSQPVPGGYIPIGATMANVRGVTIGGVEIEVARYEYEVCLRCHGDAAVDPPHTIIRHAQTDNFRLKFDAGNPSFHPIVSSSPSDEVPSLVPTMARGSLVRCTDCHSNDNGPRAGGAGPDGPHGSIYGFLLERNYTVLDGTDESDDDYAMCYKCHQRLSILSDQSFTEHNRHIVEERSPCSACHDPHGVSVTAGGGSDHTHLINFDTTIVRPVPGTTTLEFRDLGRFAGSCSLICHGEKHENERYGNN